MRSGLAVAVLLASTPFVLAADSNGGAWTPELTFKVKRVSTVRVSPDGTRAAFVVAAAIMDGEKSEWLSQIHVARSNGSGSYQLTQAEKSSTAPAWSPDGQWIAFLSTRGAKDAKDAKANIWRIRVEGGEAEQLTDEKGGISAFQWSPDGARIAFVMPDPKTDAEEKAEKEKRDARVLDDAASLKLVRLYVLPVEKDGDGKRAVRKLTAGSLSIGNLGGPAEFDWSPDGRTIAFSHQPTPHINDWPKADVSVVDVASGAVRTLSATRAVEEDPHFSADGQWLAFSLSQDPPSWRRRGRVAVIPAAGGAPRLLGDTPDHQPDLLGWTRDGRVLIVEGDRTVNRLRALPADGTAPVPVSPADVMVDGPALNATRTHVGFGSQAPDQAPEAFVSTVDRFAPVRASKVQELPALPLARTELVSWSAPDGKAIEGLLTYPLAHRPGARVPLLVVVHGGPAGVFVRSFTAAPTTYPIALFAARGYAVLRVNPRGSSGYGYEFRNANYRDWGGGDYQDIMSGVDALIAKGVADPERLGIMGWSYGGYMTSWVITQTKRFKAASVGAGVTNLMSFTGTADIPDFIPDYFGGDFWEDGSLDRWRAHSALFNVKGVSTPTLIQHGESDLRVPISQGYELYNALKRQGVDTRMIVYPRQPHGLQEPKLVLDAMKRNLEWFDRWVLGGSSVSSSGR